MGLEGRRGNDKSKSIAKNSKHNGNGENLDQNEETSYEDGKENDDLDDSLSEKSCSSVHSTLSLKSPSLYDDASVSGSSYSSATSPSEKNNSEDDVPTKNHHCDNGVSRHKASKSTASENSSLESVTFPVYKPHSAPLMQSPPPQVMDRTGEGYDRFRIPSAVFEPNISVGQIDWSAASNESLFSLHLGNVSFSSPFSDTLPSANTEGSSGKPSPENNLNRKKPRKSCEMSTVDEVAEIIPTTEDAIIEANEEEDQKEEIALPKPNAEIGMKKTTVKWKSKVISNKSEATGIPEILNGNSQSAPSFAYPAKKRKCACSSFYCSNCSLAYCSNCSCASCYCSNCSWAFCYCWNCTKRRWCLCGCCQPSEILSGELRSSPKIVERGLSPIAPKARNKSTSKRSSSCCFSCSWLNCFSCFGSESCSRRSCCSRSCFSCRSCRSCGSCFSQGCFPCRSCSSCCSCRSCSSCCSCRSCSSCCSCRSCSICRSCRSCSSCRSCRSCSSCRSCRCYCLPSSCCCSCRPCRFSSCCPSKCCCSSGKCCSFSCSSCCPSKCCCSSSKCCSFSCSSCCPFESISCRLCTSCSICPPWSFSCYPSRARSLLLGLQQVLLLRLCSR